MANGGLFLFGLIAFFSVSSPAQAQETVAMLRADSNDNGGDGFIDIIDPECLPFAETIA